MKNEWEIKGRALTCTQTQKPFEEGEFFYTLLFREKDGFRREDLCEEAWAARNDNIQPFSFWRSKFEPAPPPPPETIKKDDAEDLLRDLISRDDPSQISARYVLALMLERKRVLRPMESSDENILVYEHISSGEVFMIPNPNLSLDQIPAVQAEVSELLGSALPPTS